MNHTTFKIMHLDKQRGLTLMEVMVAITISLILLAGVMQIFLGSRQTYRMQDGLARLQENGRFAMDFIQGHSHGRISGLPQGGNDRQQHLGRRHSRQFQPRHGATGMGGDEHRPRSDV